MALFAFPRLKLTYDLSGSPVFSTQAGIHAMNSVYPCLESPWSCKNQALIKRRNREIVAERLSHLPAAAAGNPVIIDRVRRQLAVELITALPIERTALGLAAGSTKTLVQTVFYEVGDQLKMSPRYFSSIQGATFSERLAKFGDVLASNVFMIVWLVAQSVLLVSRVVQLLGCAAGLADHRFRPAVTFLLITSAYFELIGGPLGYAKYRLPMEPALIVLLSFRGTDLWQRIRAWRERN